MNICIYIKNIKACIGVENVLTHIHICMKERTLHIKQLDFKASFQNLFNGWDGLYYVYN